MISISHLTVETIILNSTHVMSQIKVVSRLGLVSRVRLAPIRSPCSSKPNLSTQLFLSSKYSFRATTRIIILATGTNKNRCRIII